MYKIYNAIGEFECFAHSEAERALWIARHRKSVAVPLGSTFAETVAQNAATKPTAAAHIAPKREANPVRLAGDGTRTKTAIAFIRAAMAETGKMPSTREIKAASGLMSDSTVYDARRLARLEEPAG